MKKTIVSLLLILSVIIGISQPMAENLKQTIRGKIIDKDTKTTIPGTHIIVLDTDPILGAISDTDGNFSIHDVPIGRHNIKISFMGYEDRILPNILVSSGKETVLTVGMTEKYVNMKTVEIRANKHKGEVLNKMATVSAKSFTVEETERYAGSFNDPSRMAMNFAGVMPNISGDNDIIIRGNSPQGLLWQMEGIDIPNPNHYASEGGTGGPISILNSVTLANSDFFTGAFPAEYGNAFSGVFDIKMRNGNNEKREYTLQMGIMGVEVAAEGPFKKGKQSSYLFNYRYSTLSLLQKMGVKVVGDAIPKFQDLTFKLNFPTKKAGVFSVFGIGGISMIHMDEETEEEIRYSYADVRTDMGAISISNMLPFSGNTYLYSVVSMSGTTDKYDEYVNYNQNDFYLYDKDNFFKYNISARTTLNHKFNSRHFIKTGVYYKNQRYDLKSKFWDERYNGLVTELDDKGSSYSIQSFANWRYRITEELTFTGGLHYMYLALNSHSSIEPRAGLKWQFNPLQSISFGYGKHSKMEAISTYMANTENSQGIEVQNNKNLDFIKAHHFVLSYDNRFNENLYFKAEAYYQDIYNVPIDGSDTGVYSILNQYSWFTRNELVNKGKGYNYGLELSLEKYFSDDYYFMFTGSVFNSQYKAGDGKWRSSKFNNNYIFNAIAGKEFRMGKKEKNRKLIISTKACYGGGHYYTPVDLEESRKRMHTVMDEGQYFSLKADPFLRIDFKIGIRRDRKNSTHLLELDIQNLSNTQSPMGMYYDIQEDKIKEYTSVGIIPTINYRIQF